MSRTSSETYNVYAIVVHFEMMLSRHCTLKVPGKCQSTASREILIVIYTFMQEKNCVLNPIDYQGLLQDYYVESHPKS